MYYESNGHGIWPSAFDPLPEMVPKDADLALLRVRKTAQYIKPVDDLLFSAHKPTIRQASATGQNRTYYLSDDIISFLGCTNQV